MSDGKFTGSDLILVGLLCAAAGAYAATGPSAHKHGSSVKLDPVLEKALKRDLIPSPTPNSPEASAATFRAALKAGNAKAAMAELADDVVIFESGHVERSRADYQAEHFIEDMKFLKSAKVQDLRQRVQVEGNTATIQHESRVDAMSKGKPVVLYSLETLVMNKIDNDWRITHIHWSSRKLENLK